MKMRNVYTLKVTDPLPKGKQLAKELLAFQMRGFPIQKALEIFKRPMTWTFTNKREAAKAARRFKNDGTGRTVTLS
jgi:hypothetical protein